jgi:hypothetical protein
MDVGGNVSRLVDEASDDVQHVKRSPGCGFYPEFSNPKCGQDSLLILNNFRSARQIVASRELIYLLTIRI